MRRTAALAAVLLVAAFVVALWARGEGRTEIEGFGLRAEVPKDWVGRVADPPAYSATLEASTMPLRGPTAPICDVDPGPEDVLLLVSDLERPQRSDSRRRPLQIGRSSINVGPYRCGFGAMVLRGLSTAGRAFSIRVLFGSRDPSDERIDEVNSILASFEVDRRG